MKKLIFSLLTLFVTALTVQAQQTKVPLSASQQIKVTSTIAQQTYTTGDSVQITNSKDVVWLIVNPAATKSTLKVKLPTRPYDNQTVYISFGGTMTSGTVVTTLTIAKTGTQVILQPTAPTTATVGQQFAYRYKSSNTRWYRVF